MMSAAKIDWRRMVCDADGFEGIEYAVMTALIVSAIIASLVSLGAAVTGSMGEITALVSL